MIDTSSVGSGILTYSYTDNAGNTGSATRIINITDQTAPEVNLSGSTSIIIFSGSTYIDLGADWVDNVDGIGDTLVGTY